MAKHVESMPNFSQCISQFCSMMEEAKRDYAWNSDEVRRMEALTQDLLHRLELEDLGYKDRAKVATQLARCRQSRRDSKNMVEVLSPLVQFLESDKGRTMMNMMRETLGKTRRVEERMKNRRYIHRILEGVIE